jgi:phenylpropionate dioxygenase-like ring-hydroxylating dioxygenase large terminal subunit
MPAPAAAAYAPAAALLAAAAPLLFLDPGLPVPPLDLALVLLLSAASLAAAAAGALSLCALLACCAAALLYASYGTCRWLSLAHAASHAAPAAQAQTSLLHRRHVGRKLPCPYPDAWYSVCFSEELLPGQVQDATVCGRALVVLRARGTNAVSVLDAYCSHLGAHLAHGQTSPTLTDADCIRCPFHGWCFNASGKLVATGSGEAPPAGSDLRAWPVLERNGVVAVWMAADGHAGAPPPPPPAAPDAPPAPPAAPWFEPPVVPALAGMRYHGMTENIVPAVIYELPENGADLGHLSALHSAFVVAALRPLLSHAWAGQWAPHATQPHLACLSIDQRMVLCGLALPGAVHVEVLQCGPSQVFLTFDLPALGRVVVTETVTPVAPALQRVLHACHAAPSVPRLVAKALLASVIRAYEQDVGVWAHKRYEPAPRLTASEASVKAFRAWARQFHASPRAVTFAAAKRAQLRVELGLADDDPLSW